MLRKIVPGIVKGQFLSSVTGSDSAFAAAKIMADAHVAAVVVVDKYGSLIGIVTERDMTQRVLAAGLDGKSVKISDIMTTNPDTLAPDDSAGDALELMRTRNYRHLPVVEDGKCIAMVSVRDLYAAMHDAMQEAIRETEAFVFGDRYGA